MKKIIYGILAIVIIAVLGFVIYVNITWNKNFSERYPVDVELKAPSDSASIARGKYLAYGPAHCAHCHVPFESLGDVEKGIEVPFFLLPKHFRNKSLREFKRNSVSIFSNKMGLSRNCGRERPRIKKRGNHAQEYPPYK